MATLHIGTSGWHYKHWVGPFYPAGLPSAKMLEWYIHHFETVEINNSFYRLPTEQAFRQWRETSPPGFSFAVKASRYLTHMKKLKEPESAIALLLERAENLGNRLGPILFQLPPHWPLNAERLEAFVSALPQRHRYVLELREPSWCVPDVYEILHRHNVALCMHDWGGQQWPRVLTADFVYIRMHGPTGDYHGKYSAQMIRDWARRISQWRPRLSSVYVYFNNDVGGHAITNAKELKRLLRVSVTPYGKNRRGPPLARGASRPQLGRNYWIKAAELQTEPDRQLRSIELI